MASKRVPLTIYRIREEIDGQTVEDFEDVIADPSSLTAHDLIGDRGFDARLFVARPNTRQPPWVPFLEPGFGDLTEVSDSVSNSAVLVAKVKYYKETFFALTFGFGRNLLKRNAFEPNYGLRIALNTLYPAGAPTVEGSTARVQSVDAKTVGANTLHTRRQTDRRTVFEDFGIDIQRDFLKAVTGQPVDTTTWGARLTGGSALSVGLPLSVVELGSLLKQIEKVWRRDDYKGRFAWIDNVRAVTDPGVRDVLESRLLTLLTSGRTENLTLAPPELVEWDDIGSFRFSVKRANSYDELKLDDYLDLLNGQNKLDDLSMSDLRSGHRIEALDIAGEQIHRWSVFNCLSGELKLDSETYVINEGDFFEVEEDYRKGLDGYVANMTECARSLPATTAKTTEGEYNHVAAHSCPDYLLLDKKTVTLSSRTSPIEICDIFAAGGCFMHVKRKLESSSLSHLFAQGEVSGELFHTSSEYREAVRSQLEAAEHERERIKSPDEPSFLGRFCTFPDSGIPPSDCEIVYGIITDWAGKNLVDALPFFSKVNLRRHAEDLRRMGYRVAYKRIQAN